MKESRLALRRPCKHGRHCDPCARKSQGLSRSWTGFRRTQCFPPVSLLGCLSGLKWHTCYKAADPFLRIAAIMFFGCFFLLLRMNIDPTAVSGTLSLASTSYRYHSWQSSGLDSAWGEIMRSPLPLSTLLLVFFRLNLPYHCPCLHQGTTNSSYLSFSCCTGPCSSFGHRARNIMSCSLGGQMSQFQTVVLIRP